MRQLIVYVSAQSLCSYAMYFQISQIQAHLAQVCPTIPILYSLPLSSFIIPNNHG